MTNLADFLNLSEAKAKAKELAELQEALKPFDEYEWGLFGSFLVKAEEYARTGILPVVPVKAQRKAAAPKAPAISLTELGEKLKVLNDRLADPALNRGELDAGLVSLDKLTHPNLKEVATHLGLDKGLSSKKTKGPYLAALKAHFVDVWGGHQRRRADG